MMRQLILAILLVCLSVPVMAQNVTIRAVNQPAATVFRSLIEQTGKNFVYSSELLKNVTVNVTAKDKPLKNVLDDMFAGTDIEYKIKGKNVVLKQKKKPKEKANPLPKTTPGKIKVAPVLSDTVMLDEVVITSRLEAPAVESAEIGAKKVTADEVRKIPVMFGEADVIKALHTLPGVTEGNEGMAGMNVHGGNADENLYMLDNVPLYQVNHFAGLFSAFNTDIIRYIDFFKSSMPAKYDGRLSSFMDVRLQNGSRQGHHGSGRLGLTSGAFNISGPIGRKTSYLFGLRRSWYDVLTVPVLAIVNKSQEEKIRLHYYFSDLNGKMTHRFSDKATAFISIYYGDDMLKTGTKYNSDVVLDFEDDKHTFHWGNFVAQMGMNYRFKPELSAEFTAAYTRFFSGMKYDSVYKSEYGGSVEEEEEHAKTSNNINDWIFRGDFEWQPRENSKVRFGAGYVRHSFLPGTTTRVSNNGAERMEIRDSTWAYGANEFNAYIENDWRITENLRVNAGFHGSIFNIDGKTKYGLSPRVSFSYRPSENMAFKAAYSRTVQYVHQLTQSYLALPTDQWIPITGNFKPQTADKIAVGGYWQTPDSNFAVTVEGYWKWLHNLIDYRDEFYLRPPMEMWNSRLSTGKGTAKGVDFMVEKLNGKITGHIAYTLAWTDRTFADKNGGKTFPARFDNRHTINVLVNWNVSRKVQLNASWTGHSGNRFTLLPQMWETPLDFGKEGGYYEGEAPLKAPVNNYQLPFYHRLDISCTVKNSRGYWTFSLYNAYNHMNTIAIKRGYKDSVVHTTTGSVWQSRPVFEKVKLLPIIPSVSYTWLF